MKSAETLLEKRKRAAIRLSAIRALADAGWSQTQIARACGVSRERIKQLLRYGHNRRPV